MKIVINRLPPSNNRFIGRNARWEYQDIKKQWAQLIRLAARPPSEPYRKAVVSIRYFFPDKRRRDPDNYSGKMILDGLVRCGVLADDSFACVRLDLSAGYDKENPRTEITITEENDV